MANYILNDANVPVAVDDIMIWARWYEKADRKLARDEIGDVRVSTVFLGMDHNFGIGPPVLWETMIFGGEHDEFQERYETRDEALAGHARALALVKGET